MNQSVSTILAMTKMQLTSTLNKIISENNIPSHLYESVIMDMLLEIRNQKEIELVAENIHLRNRILELEQEQGEKNEKNDGARVRGQAE